MSVASAEEKQEVIRKVLEGLAAAQAPAVKVRLVARIAEGPLGLRGILNPLPRPAPEPPWTPLASIPSASAPPHPPGIEPPIQTSDEPVLPSAAADESFLPPAFRSGRVEAVSAIRVGNELHVIVHSPRRGYLHLFNLGSSGDALRMLPRADEQPVLLEPGQAHLASPVPSQPWIEKGPVNGFPERVLAVITSERKALPPSCLHPSWNDAAYARGLGPPMVEALLSAWPAAVWCWGLAEAAVQA